MDNKYNGKISFQQFAAMLFVGLFSPITRALPSDAAGCAGRSAWLAPLLAFPAVLGFIAFLAAVKRRCRAGEGFSDLAVRLAGARIGRLFGAVSAAWMTVYCGFVLRCGAERLVSAVYANAHAAPFIIITGAVCAVAACGELRWRARSAQAFFPLLALTVAAILVFSMPNVRAERVWPPDVTRPGGILRAALQSLNVMLTAAYGAFLFGEVYTSGKDLRRAAVWAASAALVSALMLVCIVGILGSKLSASVQFPFFAMIRNISAFRFIDRIEPLIVALWMITDYVFVSMLMSSAAAALG
ncbi:MAG: GerAB/ArcD/ProY family transporter, partial [Oscillospiraceae bacterium]|nr:GerAB/ArcD/ProY family transporter [Oscillospiraceae bacterium]